MTFTRRGRNESPTGYERRQAEVRRTDRRWLIALVFITLIGTVGGLVLSDQQRALQHAQRHLATVERESTRNCQLLNDAHRQFNALLDAQITNTIKAQQLSPAEKQQRIKQYAGFHLVILHCPVV